MTSQIIAHDPDRARIEKLLEQVAKLCAMTTVPHERAISSVNAAYQVTESTKTNDSRTPEAFQASQILSKWHQDEFFLDTEAQPRKLSLREFSQLCRETAPGLSPDIALKILIDAKAVARDNDLVEVTSRALLLKNPNPEGVERAVELMTGYVSTLSKNLQSGPNDTKLFERAVVNTQVPSKQIPALLAYLNLHGQSFLEDLDAWMSTRERQEDSLTVGVGMYLFVKE